MTRKSALVRKEPAVLVEGGDLYTTSLIVAEKFGMAHKNVLQAIDKLNASDAFTGLNFQPSEYQDSTGRKLRMYRISEEGFMRVAFRFNSKRLGPMQDWFCTEFFRMRRYLQAIQRRQASADWRRAREEGKVARKTWGDTTARFVAYAKSQDSKGADWYFKTLTVAEYAALFDVEGETGVPMRDALGVDQLAALEVLERTVAREMEEGMAAGLPYKAIFERAKAKMAAFAEVVGKSRVLAPGGQAALEL